MSTRGTQPDVHEAGPRGRPGRPRRARQTPPARSPACLCRAHAARLVSAPARTSTGGCRCCRTYLGHVDPASDVLVSGGGPRAARADQPAPGAAAGGALMTALAPALQAFFTERLITQRNASPQTIAAYRDTFRLLLALRARADRQAAVRAGHRRSRRAADRRVPQPSRTRPGQQPQDPQRQARSDPLLLPVRGAGAPRARAHDRPGDGDPDQAPRAQHRLLPRPRRDQGAARRARPKHLARPPRPRAAGCS